MYFIYALVTLYKQEKQNGMGEYETHQGMALQNVTPIKKWKLVAILKLVSCIYFENTLVIFIYYLI